METVPVHQTRKTDPRDPDHRQTDELGFRQWRNYRNEPAEGLILTSKPGSSILIECGDGRFVEVIYWSKKGSQVKMCYRTNDERITVHRTEWLERQGIDVNKLRKRK